MLRKWNRPLLSRIWSVGLWLLVLAVLYKRVPIWLQNNELEDRPAPVFRAIGFDEKPVELPPRDHRPAILVFWATWCRPCELELKRLQKAIDDGRIPRDRVFAVSIGEPPDTVRAAARERGYGFVVFADPSDASGSLYKVQATPTTVHVAADGRVAWAATGLSPLSIWRARRLFK